jgi:hypothetical protein
MLLRAAGTSDRGGENAYERYNAVLRAAGTLGRGGGNAYEDEDTTDMDSRARNIIRRSLGWVSLKIY